MPLTGNPSHDIPVEEAAGKPHKQAVAIAMNEKRKVHGGDSDAADALRPDPQAMNQEIVAKVGLAFAAAGKSEKELEAYFDGKSGAYKAALVIYRRFKSRKDNADPHMHMSREEMEKILDGYLGNRAQAFQYHRGDAKPTRGLMDDILINWLDQQSNPDSVRLNKSALVAMVEKQWLDYERNIKEFSNAKAGQYTSEIASHVDGWIRSVERERKTGKGNKKYKSRWDVSASEKKYLEFANRKLYLGMTDSLVAELMVDEFKLSIQEAKMYVRQAHREYKRKDDAMERCDKCGKVHAGDCSAMDATDYWELGYRTCANGRTKQLLNNELLKGLKESKNSQEFDSGWKACEKDKKEGKGQFSKDEDQNENGPSGSRMDAAIAQMRADRATITGRIDSMIDGMSVMMDRVGEKFVQRDAEYTYASGKTHRELLSYAKKQYGEGHSKSRVVLKLCASFGISTEQAKKIAEEAE